MTTWPRAKPQHGINPQVFACLQYACSQLELHDATELYSLDIQSISRLLAMGFLLLPEERSENGNSLSFPPPIALHSSCKQNVVCLSHKQLMPQVFAVWLTLASAGFIPRSGETGSACLRKTDDHSSPSLMDRTLSESWLLNGAFDSTTKSRSLFG